MTGTKGEPGKKKRKLFEVVGSIYYLIDDLVQTRTNISGGAYELNMMLKNVYVL